jgi:hypothetical protein
MKYLALNSFHPNASYYSTVFPLLPCLHSATNRSEAASFSDGADAVKERYQQLARDTDQ